MDQACRINQSNENLLSLPEASRLLGIPETTLRGRIDRGTMPSYSADGYHVMVDPADIDAWRPAWVSGIGRGHNAHQVVALHGEGYTDRHISATLGISRQRVSKLRQRAGLIPISTLVSVRLCRQCGARFAPDRRGQNRCPEHRRKAAEILAFTCQECGASFQRRESTIRATSPGRYCSRTCRDQAKQGQGRVDSIPKICTECGAEYMGLASAKQSACRPCRPHVAYKAKMLRKQG